MDTICKRPLNWLLIFIPITIGLEHFQAPAVIVFFSAAMGIIPLAGLLSSTTEELARITGSTIGGLLNATFGNAPEIIIAVVMLMAGHNEMVRASIFGCIVANLLLVLGLAFFLGGLRFSIQEFSSASTKMQSTMLMIALTGMMAPGLLNTFSGKDASAFSHSLSIGLSIILLLTYILSIVYMLVTHPSLFQADCEEDAHETGGQPTSGKSALLLLLVASGMIAFMSEILAGAVDGAARALGMTEVFIGAIVLAIVGGAAESSSAIVMARRNRMNLSVQIALGSSLQIATMIFPLLVLCSYLFAPTPLSLNLSGPGAMILLLSILIATMVVSEGKSTWYKGFQLVATYLIFALLIYFIPGNQPGTVNPG